MLRIVLLILISLNIYGQTLKPIFTFDANGSVSDVVYNQNKLYISTTDGLIDIYDFETKKFIKTIKLDQIKDFMGDDIDPKVYSIDLYNDNLLFPVQAMHGYNEVYSYSNGKLNKLIDITQKQFILRAKYINDHQILYATLSNQFYLYDINNKKIIWDNQISQSKFSYFILNKNRDKFLVADESGNLKLHDVATGKFIKSFDDQNLDNVFQLDWKANKIITAGQDMKSVVYDTSNGSIYHKKARFLIYSAGLSPSGKIGAFAKYEDNDVQVFNTEYKSDIVRLTDNKMNITKILFINDNELFISSDDRQINYYKLNN